MKSKIAIVGCGPAGIQSAVYLLEHYYGEVLLYDSDTDYAKGMALDCMQTATIRGWQSILTVVDNIEDLKNAKLLIVTENNQHSLEKNWIQAAQNAQCTIYAATFEDAIEKAIEQGVPAESILGIQGLVDSKMLAKAIANELGVSVADVQGMVYGGVGKNFKSSPNLMRINGIPVHLISEGLFEKALATVKTQIPYANEPWLPYYSIAAAAVELALVMESEQNMILPITRKDGTWPCLVGNYSIQKSYANLVENL